VAGLGEAREKRKRRGVLGVGQPLWPLTKLNESDADDHNNTLLHRRDRRELCQWSRLIIAGENSEC
jgi:hypothetical protein